MRTARTPHDTRPFRGVNLGHWLVLERWMEQGAAAGPFSGTDADDELGLRQELSPTELAIRLEQHRSSYVTRDSFLWLADHGCNLVRIPVPYHVFGDSTHESCIEHLDQAFAWADEVRVPVLVDLHTVPGGQNGFDNGGASGLCTWHLSSAQVTTTLEVLERLARRYAGHPALFGLEPMNEPASKRIFADSMKRYGADHPDRVEQSTHIPHAVLAQFYRLVYERMRPILGPQVALVFHDQFRLGAWNRFMPANRYPNVWIDTHQYAGTFARAVHLRSLRAHLAVVRSIGARIALAERHHPVLVGEWSLSNNITALSTASAAQRAETMSRYATAQLAAFERGHGSCFWSLRNARSATWSFERSVAKDWLDLRN